MKSSTQKWLAYAAADIDAAGYLFQKPKANQWTYLLVVWHCHQSIEKILKANVIEKGKELLYIHDLPKLAKLADIDIPDKQKDFLFVLNQYYLTPRYPDLPLKRSYPRADKNEAKKILQETTKFFLWLKQLLV